MLNRLEEKYDSMNTKKKERRKLGLLISIRYTVYSNRKPNSVPKLAFLYVT